MKLPSIFRRKALTEKLLSPVASSGGGGWFRILEPFAGAWQRNASLDHDTAATTPWVFACTTVIAGDISKLRPRVMKLAGGVWQQAPSPHIDRLMDRPNGIQTRNQFLESWILSKLLHGNTYVLKEHDNRGRIARLHVLDPSRVTPLVSESGSVFYDLAIDNLAGIQRQVVVPADDIIHDRWNTLFHPLVGLSPVVAANVAATQGHAISTASAAFFTNRARPGGLLVAPGKISEETAARLKAGFQESYAGDNAGKIAVVGDGLKFEALTANADESQLVEQLRWSGEIVAAVYHVPAYRVGAGQVPSAFSAIEALDAIYYSQCLQRLIEDLESCLDEGLGTGTGERVEFDLSGLLRMDSKTQAESLEASVRAGVMAPNEARRMLNLPPVTGGDTPYLQAQNYSLSSLARRELQPDPFNPNKELRPSGLIYK